ncbi:unnamed protein product [Effrenium voratum]|uniref:PDZ domain-containing protein n=1 Tax=Effrenium voratum TaxID=2562239 RepID=A0AA36JIE5_9DINO|nr:unnamed protein product [Effrenium voratum]CAJ1406182.1 unnamed protein product [Effrenium voratum]CAJ1412270.1 unnamed protein product [Effrenium voratum]
MQRKQGIPTRCRLGCAPLQILLSRGAGKDDKDAAGQTALHHASSGLAAKALLHAWADVNALDLRGQRPLHCAVVARNKEVVAELLKAEADVDARQVQLKRLEVRLERPNLQQVWGFQWQKPLLLRQRRCVEAILPNSPASRWNEERAAGSEMLKPGAELLEVRAPGSAQEALRGARKLRLVFGQGADVGDSPVHLAVRQGDVPLLTMLLHARADSNLLGADGTTAFELAEHQPELLEVLMLVTSAPEAFTPRRRQQIMRPVFDDEARLSLHRAAERGDLQEVEQLLLTVDADAAMERELELTLQRRPGEELWGFEWNDFHDHRQRRVIESILIESPAGAWNTEQAAMGAETLCRGDELLEVNGQSSYEALKELRRWHKVQLVFRLSGCTALRLAAQQGHHQVVAALLRARSDANLAWQGQQFDLELTRSGDQCWGFQWDERFETSQRRVLWAMFANSPAAQWNQQMMEQKAEPLKRGDELVLINGRDARSCLALRELSVQLRFQRRRRAVSSALQLAAVAGHDAVCDLLLGAGVQPDMDLPSPLKLFSDSGKAVLELWTEEQLVTAFLIRVSDSWQAVRLEVQRRLEVTRASFIFKGRELDPAKAVEEFAGGQSVISFTVVYREELLGALKTGDLAQANLASPTCVLSAPSLSGHDATYDVGAFGTWAFFIFTVA